MKVYVIAAYDHAPQVRAIHDRLRMVAIEPTSSWAEEAHGAEALGTKTYEERYEIATRNARDLAAAGAVIALLDTPMREGWLELARAVDEGKKILLVGRHCLSTSLWVDWKSQRAMHFDTVDAALEGLAGMVRR